MKPKPLSPSYTPPTVAELHKEVYIDGMSDEEQTELQRLRSIQKFDSLRYSDLADDEKRLWRVLRANARESRQAPK